MAITFTAHNIRLDDGRCTCPSIGYTMDQHPWFQSAARILNLVFTGGKSRIRVADVSCLEGGYAVEFARLGFQTVGIEVRRSNFQSCEYVKENTRLNNLELFVMTPGISPITVRSMPCSAVACSTTSTGRMRSFDSRN